MEDEARQIVTETGLRITTARQTIEVIAKLAEEKWGDDWFVQFVREYCRIEELVTDEKPSTKNRRGTLERVFKEGGTSLQTLIWMAAAVSAELQLTVHTSRTVRI